jgi:hypothetical protein
MALNLPGCGAGDLVAGGGSVENGRNSGEEITNAI